jgi:hypothetical protein
MVTVTRTVLVDDLDGSQDDVHTVRFSLDGTDFEVDLSTENEARLRDKLARFVNNATPVRPHRKAQPGIAAAGVRSRPDPGDPRMGGRQRIPDLHARSHPSVGPGSVRRSSLNSMLSAVFAEGQRTMSLGFGRPAKQRSHPRQ